MAIYIGVGPEGFIETQFDYVGEMAGDGMGPPSPTPSGPYEYFPVTEVVTSASRPSPTHRLKWEGGECVWIESATVAELLDDAIAQTFADIDRVYADAVGLRATEYRDAELAAREYAAAGFTGPVDMDVHGWALNNPTGEVQSDEWAAKHIILRADAFRWAQKTMRFTRFERQAEMRAASTPAELRAAQAAWSDFIHGIRSTLGLPIT